MTASWLFLSILISSVGVGLFIYGKKQARVPQLIAGIVLLGYPYFVSNPWVMLGIAVVVLGLLWVLVHFGS